MKISAMTEMFACVCAEVNKSEASRIGRCCIHSKRKFTQRYCLLLLNLRVALVASNSGVR